MTTSIIATCMALATVYILGIALLSWLVIRADNRLRANKAREIDEAWAKRIGKKAK